MTISQLAERYIQAGLSPLPIRPDHSKAPDLPEWHQLQQRFATPEEYNQFRQGSGIGVIAGAVSGNLEIYDFDDAATFTNWASLVEEQLGKEWFSTLTIIKTPRPGFHVYTRCDVIGGNQKLARRVIGEGPKRQIKALIETKAEGGYVLAPGCPPTCHETGRLYEVVQGTLGSIRRLTLAEREVLMTSARALNELWAKPEPASPVLRERQVRKGLSAGDDYAAQTQWSEILTPHGYRRCSERGGVTLWTRPEKAAGVSASTNFGGSDLFYAFSTSCYPFDSERGYSKFAVYTLLDHDGDFRASAKALAAQGYGSQIIELPAMAPVFEPAMAHKPMSELAERVMDLYESGLPSGDNPGWRSVAEHWTVRKTEWTLVTGIPSHGKTAFCDAVMVNLACTGWRWAIWSAENLPQEIHVSNLLEQYIGKPFRDGYLPRMTRAEVKSGMDWVAMHFTFIEMPSDEQETVEHILEAVLAADTDGFSIDPWNELSHDFKGDKETDYISRELKRIGRFCKTHSKHGLIVAHPAKMRKETGPGGKLAYPVPTPYDVSGSAHFRNKADNCLCVWRDESVPGASVLFVQKIRRRFVGKIGRVDLRYDVATGRYFEDGMRREPGDEA